MAESKLLSIEQKLVQLDGAGILGIKTNDGKIRIGVSYIWANRNTVLKC